MRGGIHHALYASQSSLFIILVVLGGVLLRGAAAQPNFIAIIVTAVVLSGWLEYREEKHSKHTIRIRWLLV